MNEVQRNYKKQMKEIENELKVKESHGQGHFTNVHFKEKFYGKKSSFVQKTRNGGIIIFIILIIMTVSNTSFNEYQSHIINSLHVSSMEEVARVYAETLKLDTAQLKVNYENNRFFSVYTIYINSTYQGKVIGIFKNFFVFDNKSSILMK